MNNYLVKLVVAALLSLPVVQGRAQMGVTITGSSERKGDKAFYNFAYAHAIEHYTLAMQKDTANKSLILKIADSYRKLNDPVGAERWYGTAIRDTSLVLQPQHYLYYAQALSNNQKYDEARVWFEKYNSLVETDHIASRKIEGINHLSKFYTDSANYKIKLVSINSPGLDFSPMWYKEGLVFVSSRTEHPYVKSVFSWDNTNYLDLYYCDIAEGGDLANPVVFHKRVNTKYHEGPLSFFHNDSKVVFTRNNYYQGIARKSEDGITKIELYFAESDEAGDWKNITPFQYNNTEYSIGHPTISEDGNKLFFASDMEGGYGGTDIYVCYQLDGKWSAPKNLGPVVNTEGMEMFPYLNNNTLYFSSNGHEGLGGLDIYRAPLVNDEPVEVKNLGYPISSSYDDFSLIIDKQERYGYFSTNRDNKVHDNIYYFLYSGEAHAFISGTVLDNHSGAAIPGATVTVLGANGLPVADTLTDVNGQFEFEVITGREYTLQPDKWGYKRINEETVHPVNKDDIIENIILKLEPPHYVISITVVDEDTKEALPDAHVDVLDNNKNSAVKLALRERIYHEFETQVNFSYTMVGSKDGYFTNNLDIALDHKNEYDTLFYKIPLKKFEVGKAIKIDNIYYDLDKADIRADAAKELDKLVKILVDNPTIKIELSSHTDSRGSDSYNLNLSQRRAESAVAYVVSRGIAKDRIVAKGYGETQLVNNCSNGVQCSNEAHQENRRTEFKVTSN